MDSDIKNKVLDYIGELKVANISILKNGTVDGGIYGLLTFIGLFSGMFLMIHIFLCDGLISDFIIGEHLDYILSFYIVTFVALSVCALGMIYIYITFIQFLCFIKLINCSNC